MLDEAGEIRPGVRAAVDRGVNFDVGHGAGSFTWRVARAALEQGLLPGTISSDVHVWNVAGPVYDLATTGSKLLHLGLSLPEVVQRVTATPAACIGQAGQLGTLALGAAADHRRGRLERARRRPRPCARLDHLRRGGMGLGHLQAADAELVQR